MFSIMTGLLLVSLPSSFRKMVLQGLINGRVTGVIRINTSMSSAWKGGGGRGGGMEGVGNRKVEMGMGSGGVRDSGSESIALVYICRCKDT